MSREADLRAFYDTHRVADQLGFYRGRREEFDRASAQARAVAAVLLGLTALATGLAGAGVEPGWLWPVLATVLPATGTALAAYRTLYAFDQQSKIYGDTVRAVRVASRRDVPPGATAPTSAQVVARTEAALRAEHAQWGQLTTDIPLADAPDGAAR